MDIYPTWEEVGVPSLIVNSIKDASPCPLLDNLIYQLVFKNSRKPQLTFTCDNCGDQFRGKQHDNIAECVSCGSSLIHCNANLKFGKEIPQWTNHAKHSMMKISDLLSQMNSNHLLWMLARKKRINHPYSVNCGWKNDIPYCQFSGGDKVEDNSPRLCVIKAAIVCPWLWDIATDWREEYRDKIFGDHLSPIIAQFASVGWRE